MPLLILQAKAPLEPRDDRTLVAIRQIKNLRYFQDSMGGKSIREFRGIRGQTGFEFYALFEFRISLEFRGFGFRIRVGSVSVFYLGLRLT
jgi:hypothetical protein